MDWYLAWDDTQAMLERRREALQRWLEGLARHQARMARLDQVEADHRAKVEAVVRQGAADVVARAWAIDRGLREATAQERQQVAADLRRVARSTLFPLLAQEARDLLAKFND